MVTVSVALEVNDQSSDLEFCNLKKGDEPEIAHPLPWPSPLSETKLNCYTVPEKYLPPRDIRDKLDALHVFPKCVVFDLDDTLWRGDVDCTSGPPFYFGSSSGKKGQKITKGGHPAETPLVAVDCLYDSCPSKHVTGGSRGTSLMRQRSPPALSLFPDVASVFTWLYTMQPKIRVAIASRTTEPKWASEALKGFRIPVKSDDFTGVPFHRIVAVSECYPRCKKQHIAAICRALKLSPSDLVFYDNLYFNITDVQSFSTGEKKNTRASGVTCVYTPTGLNWNNFYQGLLDYQSSVERDRR